MFNISTIYIIFITILPEGRCFISKRPVLIGKKEIYLELNFIIKKTLYFYMTVFIYIGSFMTCLFIFSVHILIRKLMFYTDSQELLRILTHFNLHFKIN